MRRSDNKRPLSIGDKKYFFQKKRAILVLSTMFVRIFDKQNLLKSNVT